MTKNKTNAKGLIAAFKAMFQGDGTTPLPADNEPVKGKFAGVTAAYNITGAAPVYVDISDDGLPDIDQGDNVYADAAESTPYPDGTYTVDGTQFSFTVVAGVVTVVVDATGAGPGAPIQAVAPAAPAQQPAQQQTAPMPAPAPMAQPLPPQFSAVLPTDFAAFKAMFSSDAKEPLDLTGESVYKAFTEVVGKFATGTTEDRIVNLETMVKGLMLYCFGYQIQSIDQQAAINTYQTAVEQLQAQSQRQTEAVNNYKEAGVRMANLFEEFLNLPDAAPVTVNEKDRTRFEKNQVKENNLLEIAGHIKGLKKTK